MGVPVSSLYIREDRCSGRVLAALALLAILAYLPALRQPLLEDDYPNISLALSIGAPNGLGQLAESVFRLRATSYWLTNAIYHAFGMTAVAYYCFGILMHVLNTWLVYALGFWRPLGYELAGWAAGFFALYEGHVEAVLWFTASTELLMFLFGMSSLLCWVRFLDAGGRGWLWYVAALFCFTLSLISKESAVIFAPLLILPLFSGDIGRGIRYLTSFLFLAGAAAFLIYESRTYSFRFQDGSFSLHAPFWIIWPLNLARLFWFWGLLALVAASWAAAKRRRTVLLALVWMGLGLVPYSFLTYSLRIPSRQTYLASVGLAWIVAVGLLAFRDRFCSSRRRIFIGLCAVMMMHNIGYMWTKKRQQFLQRAEPTEQLIALARSTHGLIYVRCFPRQRIVAEDAVRLSAGRAAGDLIWDAAEASARGAVATFCYVGN